MKCRLNILFGIRDVVCTQQPRGRLGCNTHLKTRLLVPFAKKHKPRFCYNVWITGAFFLGRRVQLDDLAFRGVLARCVRYLPSYTVVIRVADGPPLNGGFWGWG